MTAVLPDTGLIEGLELAEPGCDFFTNEAVDSTCGATPVTHVGIAPCWCRPLFCTPCAAEVVANLADRHSWPARCRRCGRRGLRTSDFRVVPL